MVQSIPGGGIDLSHLAQRQQAASGQHPNAGGPGPRETGATVGAPSGPGDPDTAVDVPSLVIDVTDQTFEQAAQLSGIVPLVIDLWADWCAPCKQLTPVLEQVTRSFGGRIMLAKVDVDANPGLAQAFQAQSIPTVVALVGGRPVPLFQGALPEAQVREYFTQLVQLAEQQGVTGRVNAPDVDATAPTEPAEPQIPEAHIPAMEAAERGDYDAAVREWEAVLLRAPADQAARDALVQMKLLQRLQGVSAEEVRSAAAQRPDDIAAQLAVADLDVSGGHVEDAFLRLLERFADADEEGRTRIRERLVELFEVVGAADPRVNAARGRLASLMF